MTTLFAWPLTKDHANHKIKKQSAIAVSAFKKATKLFMIFILFSVSLMAQQVQQYTVLYKGKDIGKMHLSQMQNGDETFVKVVSNIQVRMLMTVKVNVAEEASYKQDKLMYSSIYREVNGKQKANRQTKYAGDGYQTTAEGKTGRLDKKFISYNLVKLYCKEPINIEQVYSDNFQQFLNIKNIASHTYRLDLPDGNFNVYYYQNGICNKVDVHSSYFTIQMQLAA